MASKHCADETASHHQTMNTEIIISIVALVTSLISLVFTVSISRRQIHADVLSTNQAALIGVEGRIAEIPSALRFHGIDPKELDGAGITPAEFAYLVNSFTCNALIYRTKGPFSTKPFAPGSYRYEMCRSPATRRAWPILRRMFHRDDYLAKVQNTIDLIERAELGKSSDSDPNQDNRH
jgi:hypothetical protein